MVLLQDLGSDSLGAYYGANLLRLTEIKRRYDPYNYFNYPNSIPVAENPRPVNLTPQIVDRSPVPTDPGQNSVGQTNSVLGQAAAASPSR